ncbi:MAG TPA: CoA-binding protein [Nitrososphaera sp.]
MKRDSYSDAEIVEFFALKNIAVVGMSRHSEKAAQFVPKYLIKHGYNVIPVNPSVEEILGRKSFPTVSSISSDIDVVDIFRPSEDVLLVVTDSIKKQGIKLIWMQEGIYNEQAEQAAREKGIKVVYNRCMMAEHMRLFSDMD